MNKIDINITKNKIFKNLENNYRSTTNTYIPCNGMICGTNQGCNSHRSIIQIISAIESIIHYNSFSYQENNHVNGKYCLQCSRYLILKIVRCCYTTDSPNKYKIISKIMHNIELKFSMEIAELLLCYIQNVFYLEGISYIRYQTFINNNYNIDDEHDEQEEQEEQEDEEDRDYSSNDDSSEYEVVENKNNVNLRAIEMIYSKNLRNRKIEYF